MKGVQRRGGCQKQVSSGRGVPDRTHVLTRDAYRARCDRQRDWDERKRKGKIVRDINYTRNT